MTRENRLRKIGLYLTPKQASIAYIARQLRYESLADYSVAICKRWDSEPRLAELCDQVEESVEYAFYQRDEDESACKAAAASAKREALFLAFLHQQVVARADHDEGLLILLSELLDDKLALIVALGNQRFSPRDLWIQEARIESLRETVKTLATLFYRNCLMVQIIQTRYFDGKNILFNSSREHLKYIGDQLERFPVICRTLFRDVPAFSNVIDLRGVRKDAELHAEFHCSDLADAAKADALSYLGDRDGAMSVARKAVERLTRRLDSKSAQTRRENPGSAE